MKQTKITPKWNWSVF